MTMTLVTTTMTSIASLFHLDLEPVLSVESKHVQGRSRQVIRKAVGRDKQGHQKTKYGLVVYQEKIVGGKGEISTTPIHCIGAIKVVYS